MGVFFCERCKKDTEFLPTRNTVQIAGVSRSTVYYWMEHYGYSVNSTWSLCSGELNYGIWTYNGVTKSNTITVNNTLQYNPGDMLHQNVGGEPPHATE